MKLVKIDLEKTKTAKEFEKEYVFALTDMTLMLKFSY